MPANPRNTRLITNSIGLRTWETVNIVHKGANYGYSLREGNETLQADNKTTALPDPDTIPVRISDTVTTGTVVPTYPVIQYPHLPGGGDAVGSGFLYRGTRLPALRGKYVFTDISTGRLWYADYSEMLAADDGNPKTLAALHEMKLLWKDPAAGSNGAKQIFDTMFPIAKAAYHARGGKAAILPGRAFVSGEGRADAHVAVDGAGELYLFSKTDGMLRVVVEAVERVATTGGRDGRLGLCGVALIVGVVTLGAQSGPRERESMRGHDFTRLALLVRARRVLAPNTRRASARCSTARRRPAGAASRSRRFRRRAGWSRTAGSSITPRRARTRSAPATSSPSTRSTTSI